MPIVARRAPPASPGSLKNLLVFRKILPFRECLCVFAFTKLYLRLCSFLLKIHSKRWKILRAICGGGGVRGWETKKKLNSGEWLWGTILGWNFCVSEMPSAFTKLFPMFCCFGKESWKAFAACSLMKNIFVVWGFAFSTRKCSLSSTWVFLGTRQSKMKPKLRTHTAFQFSYIRVEIFQEFNCISWKF